MSNDSNFAFSSEWDSDKNNVLCNLNKDKLEEILKKWAKYYYKLEEEERKPKVYNLASNMLTKSRKIIIHTGALALKKVEYNSTAFMEFSVAVIDVTQNRQQFEIRFNNSKECPFDFGDVHNIVVL